MKIEYDAVADYKIDDFIIQVNAMLDDGWKLQGGIAISDRTTHYSEHSGEGGDSDFTLAQAFYREVPDLTPDRSNVQSPSSAELPTTPLPTTGEG